MIRFAGRNLHVLPNETVLECLGRHGIAHTSSCRSGVCMTCVLRSKGPRVPESAQVGLKPAWVASGYFLACICRPIADMDITTIDDRDLFETKVVRTSQLSPAVWAVWLSRPPGLEFRGGQFLRLIRPSDGLSRPYSIASTDREGEIELHVAVRRLGRMSRWLPVAVGQSVLVRGAFGDCFYAADAKPEQPLLLAASGTGFAPVLGVLREALERGHSGPICVFHAARSTAELYSAQTLSGLARRHANVSVQLTAPGREETAPLFPVRDIALDALVKLTLPELRGWHVFLAGGTELVHRLKKQSFLSGARLSDIHADAFVEAPRGA
jgi:ferredoxin-NADP reductase/ferredoxin